MIKLCIPFSNHLLDLNSRKICLISISNPFQVFNYDLITYFSTVKLGAQLLMASHIKPRVIRREYIRC